MPPMKRRDFLKTPGYFVAAATLGGTAACGGSDNDTPDAGPARMFMFPQGVASGDPRDTSVVLWTRVESDINADASVDVTVQVSDAMDFGALVLETTLTVGTESDHTLRLLVTDLAPATRYYYRFLAGDAQSEVGRTLTAPPSDDTANVNLAWVSCQDYASGVFSAYRQMIIDDEARPASEQIQFVLHLGDFIYETIAQGFQGAIDDQFQPIEVIDRDDVPRRVDTFPSGGGQAGDTSYAATLDDYRHLYKQFLRDPDLRAARARWPFIQTWDDHEFSNDSWQTQGTYLDENSLNEPYQTRKVACHQAWFEYIPTNLSDAVGVEGVANAARDFVPTQVTDTPYSEVDDNNLITEANNVAALASMTIYRSLRYGQNIELVITDERSYRSDHPIPEEQTESLVFFHPRNAVPLEMVDIYDAGREANGGNPPDTVVQGMFQNPRKDSPPGTMLGAAQKAWWKQTMQQSDATWKLWGNSVPLIRILAKVTQPSLLLVDRVSGSDTWDGYNYERTELMTFLRDSGIDNVIVLTGDIHAHVVGQVVDDYTAPAPTPVAAEFSTAGISSNSLFSFYESAARALGDVRSLVTYDATPLGGDTTFTNNLNVLFLHGESGASAAAQTHSIPSIEAASDPDANPHLRFIDSDAQGYGLLTVTPNEVTATMVSINRPIVDNGDAGPGIKGTATFTVQRDNPGSLSEPTFAGEVPFPFA